MRRLASRSRAKDRLDAILRHRESALGGAHAGRDPRFERLEDPAAAAAGPHGAPWRARRVSLAFARMSRRSATAARRTAMPASLGVVLAVMALVRLPSANTGWTEQLVVDSSVGTGDFKCDPVQITFIEAKAAVGGTKFVYGLSGGGGTGPTCQKEAISQVFIPVCFAPALKPTGDVVSESHPGAGNTSWKYSTGAASKLRVRWDALVTDAPLGGAGPFDPLTMRFSFTLAGAVSVDSTPVHAGFKAGSEEFDAGLVKAPKCPLPEPVEPLEIDPASEPAEEEVEDTAEPSLPPAPEPEPEPEPNPKKQSNLGPVSVGPGSAEPRPRPTPTPAPVGVSAWK